MKERLCEAIGEHKIIGGNWEGIIADGMSIIGEKIVYCACPYTWLRDLPRITSTFQAIKL